MQTTTQPTNRISDSFDAIMFSKQSGNGTTETQYWNGRDNLPYPFMGLEAMISDCKGISFKLLDTDGCVYRLQSVNLVPTPNVTL